MIKESGNRTKVSQSQLELAGATNDVHLATAALLTDIRRFEETKRTDLRSVLGGMRFALGYILRGIQLYSYIQLYSTRLFRILIHGNQLSRQSY